MQNFENMSYEDFKSVEKIMERKHALEGYIFPSKPSSDGYYHINVKDESKKTGRRQIKAKTLEELQDKVFEYEKGIDGKARKTFKDIFELIQNRKLELASEDALISVRNTVNRNRSDYSRYIKDSNIEDKMIDKITKKDLDKLIIMNLKKYKLKAKAFNNLKTLIKSVMDLAYFEYWIEDNPYNRLNFKDYKGLLKPEDNIDDRAYSNAELDMITESCRIQQLKFPKKSTAYALEMEIEMGTRVAELVALRWDDIYSNYIDISSQQLRNIHDDGRITYDIVNHTKTHQDRKFPITENIADILIRLKKLHDSYYPDNPYLFPQDSDNPITKKQLKDFFDYRIKKLGIKKKGLTLGCHSFRRNAISKVCDNTNGNIILAAELFGNSPVTAAKNYKVTSSLDVKLKALCSN